MHYWKQLLWGLEVLRGIQIQGCDGKEVRWKRRPHCHQEGSGGGVHDSLRVQRVRVGDGQEGRRETVSAAWPCLEKGADSGSPVQTPCQLEERQPRGLKGSVKGELYGCTHGEEPASAGSAFSPLCRRVTT